MEHRLTPPEVLRCFIALPLSATVTAGLDAVQRQLKRRCPSSAVRWVAPASIHLTLCFLGDVLDERVAEIKAGLGVVTRYAERFTLEVGGLGGFPNAREPRVVWVGIQEPTGQLNALAELVREAMARVGFTPEARAFSPHLTLARVQRHASRDESRTVGDCVSQTAVGTLGQVQAEQITLFRSFLKSTGAEYTPLATFPLQRE